MPKQRSNGDGYKMARLKNGGYSQRITLGIDPYTGKAVKKCFKGKTPAEVKSNAHSARLQFQKGAYKEPDTITVGEWLIKWLNEYQKGAIKISTFISYEGYINNHIIPAFGNIKLLKLRVDTVNKFYKEKLNSGRCDTYKDAESGELKIKEGGLSAKTIREMHNVLHKSFLQAVKNGIMDKNIIELVDPPKVSKKEIKVFTFEEQQRLMKEAQNHRLGNLILFALYTGMRRGELLGLIWSDIDFEQKHFTIKRTLNRLKSYDETNTAKSKITLSDPKTYASNRTIPITGQMQTILEQQELMQSKEKSLIGNEYNVDGYVFCTEYGTAIEPRTLHSFYKKLCTIADVPQITFHAMRHTFATRALEGGIDIKTASDILGHKSVSFTMDTYMHSLLDNKRNALESVAAFVGQ